MDPYFRYSRQLKLLGEEGQRKLKDATVFVAGIGGLGGTAALYLAAAGIGKLILAHEGIIAEPDLNRQILMDSSRLGEPRIPCAIESIKRINPGVEIEGYPERITYERAIHWAEKSDVIIDARYDFPERYELNRVARDSGKPMVEAAMYGFEVSLTTIIPGKTPCLECLYPVRDATWEPLGFPVLGATSGIAGCLASIEAIKLITGIGHPYTNRMYRLNTLDFSTFNISFDDAALCTECEKRKEALNNEHKCSGLA